jgi:transcription initiation factor TFIID subunit 10
VNANASQDKDKDKDKDKEPAKDKAKGKEEKEEEEADIFAARREEENARRDRSLAEFLVMLDGYKPLVSCGLCDELTADPRGGHRVLPPARRL